MKYPYDYEVEESNKGLITAGIIVGVLTAGSIAFALLNRKNDKNDKGETLMNNNSNNVGSSNVEIVDNSKKAVGKEFFMPHFMLKKFTVKPNNSGLTVNVDYVIDELLNRHLLKDKPQYSYRLTLPAAYKDMFENNGVMAIDGTQLDNGKKNSNTATFEFKKKKDITGKAIDMMNEETGKYKFEILDNDEKAINSFDDIRGATNIIRF